MDNIEITETNDLKKSLNIWQFRIFVLILRHLWERYVPTGPAGLQGNYRNSPGYPPSDRDLLTQLTNFFNERT